MNLISLKDVWLKYRVEFKENGRLIPEDFWALKGINIDIDRGEVVGVIGENGAGKTTMLKIIAGMLTPDKGTVEINGTVSALMEIGAGFQQDLTGRENIYLISSLFGLSKSEIDKRYDDIVRFAAIGRFINAPVRIYSQGMHMRLAFAIAIHVDPDVLLVDDTLTVGDIYAQRKCINKIFELKEKGKTIIFVTQDIEMSKRLCTKGIFIREGTIIKEGSIDKLCSYYIESVGDKKGIAVIQKDLLGIVFNNGKLVLRWRDKTITRNLSLHAIMFSLGREYLSTTANWQVRESKSKDEIIASGNWPDLSATQNWKIIVLNEKEFVCEIAMDVPEEISIEKFRTSVIFIDEYRGWFTLASETDFPETFIHAQNWESFMIEDPLDRVIGLRGNGKIAGSPPTIVFDRVHDNTKMICQTGNTGSDISGRALICEYLPENSNQHYIQGQYRCFSARVRIFKSEKDGELKLYLEDTKQLMRESTIIRKDSLSLFCKNRKVEIYWQDRLITHGTGLNTKFRCQDKNYSAQDGHWSISKENSEEIVVNISWQDEPKFTQIWRLRLEDRNAIVWKIDMKTDAEVKIRNKQAELILNDGYNNWITEAERGDFKRLSKQGNAIVLNRYINDMVGVEEISDADTIVLPRLLFIHDGSGPAASYLSKIDEEKPVTKLRYLEIDREENFYASPGRYEYFSGEVKIDADKKPAIISRRSEPIGKIGYNKTSLVFEHGKGRLFWKGAELTKGLGLYSSVLSGGMWYDSSQALWQIQRLEARRLIAIGRWPWIPMTQTWEISLSNEKLISWKIVKEIWEDIILEREQANIMLSDRYKEWFTNKRIHGRFPETFGEHNGFFWDRLWCGDTASTVGIKKCRVRKGVFTRMFLPSVVFGCSAESQARYCVIENTDNIFEGRILQCELDSKQQRGATQKTRYFDSQIRIIT